MAIEITSLLSIERSTSWAIIVLLPLYNLASLNYYKKNYDEALNWIEKSLKINSSNSYTYRILGYIYKAQGQVDKANEAFSKVK